MDVIQKYHIFHPFSVMALTSCHYYALHFIQLSIVEVDKYITICSKHSINNRNYRRKRLTRQPKGIIVELYIVIFRSRIKVAHTIRLMMKHSWYNLQEGKQLKIPADDDQHILLKYKSLHTRESHRLWNSWNPKLLMKLVASYTGNPNDQNHLNPFSLKA